MPTLAWSENHVKPILLATISLCWSCTGGPGLPSDSDRTEVDSTSGLVEYGDDETSAFATDFRRVADLLAANQADEALLICQRLATTSDQKARGFIGIGSCRTLQQEYALALAAYEKAHTLEPQLYGALLGMGSACIRLQRYPDAINWCRQAARNDPTMPDSYYGLALAYDHEHMADSAVANAQRYMAMAPRSNYIPYMKEIIAR